MDTKLLKVLLDSARQHIKTAKHAKAIGWTGKEDLYEYSVRIAEEELAEAEGMLTEVTHASSPTPHPLSREKDTTD